MVETVQSSAIGREGDSPLHNGVFRKRSASIGEFDYNEFDFNEFDGIGGWQKTSYIDFPGVMSTVIFLSGCNLRCPYCHNKGIIAERYKPIPYGDIRKHIVKRKNILEGVVISGGEPTLHNRLKILCDDLKSLGMKVKIDTNGLKPEIIDECSPDYLSLDVKTSFDKYPRLSNGKTTYNDYGERLRRSISIVKRKGDNAEVRIVAAPNIIDKDDVDELCVELKGVKKIFIQQAVQISTLSDYNAPSVKPYQLSELEKWQEKFLNAGINCRIREA